MTKPATLPRWATDLTNNDAPSSTQMDTGWTPGQTGVSDYDNYIKYWTYQWTAWLDALFDSSGNLVMDADASITLSGTGTYKRPARKRKFSVVGSYFSGGTMNVGGYWTSTATAEAIYIPLVLEEGERITEVVVYTGKDSVQTASFSLASSLESSSLSALSDNFSTSAGAGAQTITINTQASAPLAFDVAGDGRSFAVWGNTTGAPGSGGVAVYGVTVTTLVP